MRMLKNLHPSKNKTASNRFTPNPPTTLCLASSTLIVMSTGLPKVVLDKRVIRNHNKLLQPPKESKKPRRSLEGETMAAWKDSLAAQEAQLFVMVESGSDNVISSTSIGSSDHDPSYNTYSNCPIDRILMFQFQPIFGTLVLNAWDGSWWVSNDRAWRMMPEREPLSSMSLYMKPRIPTNNSHLVAGSRRILENVSKFNQTYTQTPLKATLSLRLDALGQGCLLAIHWNASKEARAILLWDQTNAVRSIHNRLFGEGKRFYLFLLLLLPQLLGFNLPRDTALDYTKLYHPLEILINPKKPFPKAITQG